MTNRRSFIKQTALAAGGALLTACSKASNSTEGGKSGRALVISTWYHGLAANEGAWKVLSEQGNALDAVEQGVSVTESDLSNSSVGLGGKPDRDGHVTLDACIMDHNCNCGSVAFLENIDHPIQVARKVMEETPHVMIVGEGAYQFALEHGFERSKNEIPQPKIKEQYEEWKKKSEYQPKANIENHDTIGLLALDTEGKVAGACTTSGMAYKIHGRVGDSPIIGAGLFVDGDVGAATATGVGEMVIRIAGSHTVVELMRQGRSPEQACKEAVERIISKHENLEEMQVGFLAVNLKGEVGAYAIRKGFNYALQTEEGNEMHDAPYLID